MELAYIHSYRSTPLSHRKLLRKLKHKYSEYPLQQPLIYDELLYIFDSKCSTKCNRLLVEELFQQAKGVTDRCTL